VHPTLLHIGPFPVHTYGLLIAIGFLVSVQVIKFLSEKSKLNVDLILDLTFWNLLVGFLGARTLFVITRWESFMSDPLSIFKVWEGGLVFYGGPIFAIPLTIWFLRKNKLPLWRTIDVLAPGLVIGHAFGRLGCLAAGCCYGKPTGGNWGIKFDSELVDIPLRGVYLHPTQIYESVALFLVFIGLLFVFRRKKFDGQVGLVYLMVYPIVRSIIEAFRGDVIRGFVIDGILSTSQFISILMFLGATTALVLRLNGLSKKSSPLAP
jgi:phosphatidylglycerol---prolipoprotein diacylglyceryl transferase